MSGNIASLGSSPAQLNPDSTTEENPNLDNVVLALKVTCVVLAVLVVVGFVLAVALSGAWMVVIPAMVLYAAATIAIPFALHFLGEFSLAQASLVAQQGSGNNNTQENRSQMSSAQLKDAHSRERNEMIREQVNRGISNEQADLELEKLKLKFERENIDLEYREQRERIENGDGEKGEEDPSIQGLREAELERKKKTEQLNEEYIDRKIENEIKLKNLEFKEKELLLNKYEEKSRNELEALIENRKCTDSLAMELYRALKEVYQQKQEVLEAEKGLELYIIQNPNANSIDENLLGLKNKLRTAKRDLDEKEKEFNKLKSDLPRDPNTLFARAIDFVDKHMPPLPSLRSLSSSSSLSSPPPSNKIDEKVSARLMNSLDKENKSQVQRLEESLLRECREKHRYFEELGASEQELRDVDFLLNELGKLRVLELKIYLIINKGISDLSYKVQFLQKHRDILQEVKIKGEMLERLQNEIERRVEIFRPLTPSSEGSSSSSSSGRAVVSIDEQELLKEMEARHVDSEKQEKLIKAFRNFEACKNAQLQFCRERPLGEFSHEERTELTRLEGEIDKALNKYQKLKEEFLPKKRGFFSWF
ncbi:MAG TPA: hypothetical protein DCE71_03775 [Parachlamydiales bacterium]|nr:hypothetical protein [Parachlamydiales bacterium]